MISANLTKVLLGGVFEGLFLTLPFWIVAAGFWFTCRRKAHIRPPQREKLLKPPGHSLGVKLDEALLSSAFTAFAACATGAILESVSGLAGAMAGWGSAAGAGIAGLFSAGVIVSVAVLGLQSFRALCRAEKLRLGLRGEQAVAEAINELREVGFRAFHDLQPTGTWNLDHVLVGTRGLFVIETKARSKHPTRTEQQIHEVVYDGEALLFPNGSLDRAALVQAQRNAAWLADFVAKKTAEITPAKALVVLPGWFVTTKGDYPVKVMNSTYLVGFLRRQPESISPAQVRRIVAALDEKCRVLEF